MPTAEPVISGDVFALMVFDLEDGQTEDLNIGRAGNEWFCLVGIGAPDSAEVAGRLLPTRLWRKML